MANKTIRGITIEIGGDTTKLGKALEDSEKKSRSLQVELKEVQNGLKFDPSNVELLTQKQTVLTQNIDETSKKLEVLKEAEKQVIAQFERGEVAEEQVRALKREIINTEGSLGKMKTELNNTSTAIKDLADGVNKADKNTDDYADSVDKAEKELKELGEKASETFDVIGKGIGILGAGVTATAGYAVNLSTEFDKAYNTLQTRTGATAEEMDSLNESMENIYKNNLGENMDDIAVSMATVKTQTELVGQELEKTTSNALVMRDTFGFEVNESIRAVNSLMKQFGITADEAYALIAQGAQKGLNQNDDLLDTINEYSVQFGMLGYSADDMFNMLNNGAKEGTWSIDKLGDAVKEFNIRTKDGSDTTVKAFEALGLVTADNEKGVKELFSRFAEGGDSANEATQEVLKALIDMEDKVEQDATGVALFGTMWEDLGVDAISALMSTQGEISKTSDALDKINDQKYDDIGSALEGLGRTLQTDLVEPIGEELKPVIEDAIEYVQDNGPAIKDIVTKIVTAIGDFVKLIVDNADVILATITGIGVGMLTWNVASIINAVVNSIRAFKLANEGATISQWALNMAMNANPIGIIVSLIAGLVTAFTVLWNTSEGFRNFWIGLWEGIKNIVGTVVEAIAGFFVGLWDGIVGIFSSIGEWFSNVFSSVYNAITSIMSPIVDFFVGLWDGIVAVFSPVVEWFSALFMSIYNTLYSIISNIIAIVRGVWITISTIFSVVATWFYDNVIKPVAGFFSNLFGGIADVARTCWNAISGVFSTVATWFNNTVIKPVTKVFTGLWDGLKNGAKKAWSGIKSVFSSVANFFGDIFGTAWKKVKNIFSVGGKIFDGIKDGIVSAFKAIVNGIIKGINKVVALPFDGINWALKKIKGISILGIKPFDWISTISVPQLPLLYRGGVLKKGQVGLLEGNGAEAVVPLEKETGWINRIAQKMNEFQDPGVNFSDASLINKMDEMIQTMKALKSTIVLDTGALVGETINQFDEQLGNTYTLKARRI